MIPLGKVEKMKIRVYASPADEAALGEYEFTINPETYSHRFEIDRSSQSAAGSQGNTQVFVGHQPAELEFDILIDGTGVIKNAGVLDISIIGQAKPVIVQEQVNTLRNLVVDVDGEIHQTRYVKITWGDRPVFKGSIVSLDLNYKLFDTSGNPLRVLAKLRLREWQPADGEARTDPFASPDITHERTFKASDKFSLITNKIYDSPSYYIDVARANELDSFRKIPIGTSLNFPPVK